MSTEFKKGDWIVRDNNHIGKVKDVYQDGRDLLLDIVLYDRAGNKIGRESPALGGPTSFEPACTAKWWRRIKEPHFPLSRQTGEWYDLRLLKDADA